MAKKKKKKEEKVPTRTGALARRRPRYLHPWDIMRRLDEEFESFRKDLERSIWWPGRWRLSSLAEWPETSWPEVREPLVDVRDTGKDIVVEAEMAGIPRENIDVRVTEDSVEISGDMETAEEKEEEGGYYHQERSFARCYRRMPLPTEVIPEKADAKLTEGILRIKIPKKTPTPKAKGYKVKIE